MDDKRNEVLCPRCGVRINDNKTNMCMRCGYLFNSNEVINRSETAIGQIQPDKKSVVFMAIALGNLFTIVPGIIYFAAAFLKEFSYCPNFTHIDISGTIEYKKYPINPFCLVLYNFVVKNFEENVH